MTSLHPWRRPWRFLFSRDVQSNKCETKHKKHKLAIVEWSSYGWPQRHAPVHDEKDAQLTMPHDDLKLHSISLSSRKMVKKPDFLTTFRPGFDLLSTGWTHGNAARRRQCVLLGTVRFTLLLEWDDDIIFTISVGRVIASWRHVPGIESLRFYHKLRASGSTVVTATPLWIGKSRILTSYRTNIPKPITTKFVTVDNVGESTPRTKFGVNLSRDLLGICVKYTKDICLFVCLFARLFVCLFVYTCFLQRTYRSDRSSDFNARWLKSGIVQESAYWKCRWYLTPGHGIRLTASYLVFSIVLMHTIVKSHTEENMCVAPG